MVDSLSDRGRWGDEGTEVEGVGQIKLGSFPQRGNNQNFVFD